jgi:phosphatidylserine decarboxylase
VPALIIAVLFFAIGIEVPGFICLAIAGMLLFFFRDPERRPPRIPGALVSPADGKVVGIREAADDGTGETCPGIRVDIFMSLFNVHVNRSPVDARVTNMRYRPGKFFNACTDKASVDNEANFVYLEQGTSRFLVTQIAGLVARRIICPIREGDELAKGERIGLIGLGSRVEFTFPSDAQVRVKVGQHVRAGESVIAILSTDETEEE